ncbi:hypothetical protein BH23VER1_BH23VER1_20630 [soil metagenome]
MSQPVALLDAAENVLAILRQALQTDAVVIGAIALAAHRYVRFTEDVDLGINAEPDMFREIGKALGDNGYQVALHEPGADDPLSGVIDVRGTFGLIQIVNFGQTFPAVIRDALRDAILTVRPGSHLRLAPLPQLVAMKLYAGGLKSQADIVELLARNPDADLDEIRAICRGYRLCGVDEVLGSG